jgi:hypothetical protein
MAGHIHMLGAFTMKTISTSEMLIRLGDRMSGFGEDAHLVWTEPIGRRMTNVRFRAKDGSRIGQRSRRERLVGDFYTASLGATC